MLRITYDPNWKSEHEKLMAFYSQFVSNQIVITMHVN